MDAIHIFNYLESETAKPYRRFLSEKRFSSKELGESYRVINHWTDLGLLPDDRDNDAKWRKFSIVDIVWTLIIKELRQFGLPLDKIKKARSDLFEIPFASDWPEFELEFHIFLTMIKRDVHLLVMPDGFATLLSNQDFPLQEVLQKSKSTNSMMVISLNKIMAKVFPNKDFKPFFPLLKELTQDEFELLSFIRFNNFIEVLVKLDNGKIQRFDGKKRESLEGDLLDLIYKNKYQKVTIVQAEGNTIAIERTVQQKPSQYGKNSTE
jgi:hypothetical protein